jgi:hypothetical protein
MSPSRFAHPSVVRLAVLLPALAAMGCVGPFRRAFAPEQRIQDADAARLCAVRMMSELGYVAVDEPNPSPTDSTGESRFTAERRGTTADGTTVVDQLAVSVRAPEATVERGRLRVVPARYEEDSRQAMSPGRRVPRLRPPGPAEGAARLETNGIRRRRVDAGAARRDALELTTRCGVY